MKRDPQNSYLDKLRQWRNRPDPDLSLGFLKKQFKQEVEKPHKQLQAIVEAWRQLVPAALAQHARLEALAHGVLRVSVDSSPYLFELDRMLRAGLQQQLSAAARGANLRRVQIRLMDTSARTPRRSCVQEPDQEMGL